MKKIITLSILALFASVGVNAQQTGTTGRGVQSDSTSITTSTVINTGSKIQYVAVSNAWDVVTIQAVITKVSGTVAGVSIPVVSNDGVNFVAYHKPWIAATSAQKAYSDSLTSTNVTTNSKIWVFANNAHVDGSTPLAFPFAYVGVQTTGSGTMVATLKTYATFRHK